VLPDLYWRRSEGRFLSDLESFQLRERVPRFFMRVGLPTDITKDW
jgi:hypothetical protein